jgi:hypothetical protein
MAKKKELEPYKHVSFEEALCQCKYGHPFSGDNLRIQQTGKLKGRRKCRACERIGKA